MEASKQQQQIEISPIIHPFPHPLTASILLRFCKIVLLFAKMQTARPPPPSSHSPHSAAAKASSPEHHTDRLTGQCWLWTRPICSPNPVVDSRLSHWLLCSSEITKVMFKKIVDFIWLGAGNFLSWHGRVIFYFLLIFLKPEQKSVPNKKCRSFSRLIFN